MRAIYILKTNKSDHNNRWSFSLEFLDDKSIIESGFIYENESEANTNGVVFANNIHRNIQKQKQKIKAMSNEIKKEEVEFKRGELIEVNSLGELDWYPVELIAIYDKYAIVVDTQTGMPNVYFNYRKLVKQPLAGHNPDGVTELTQGCIRLLDEDEIGVSTIRLQEIYVWLNVSKMWSSAYAGEHPSCTYATSLTREELAEKRGLTKKEPVLVPWTSIEEVPLDAWFRQKGLSIRLKITGLNQFNNQVYFIKTAYSLSELEEDWEYSHDLKTWKPCGKEVQS
jgi:hypothetical protein